MGFFGLTCHPIGRLLVTPLFYDQIGGNMKTIAYIRRSTDNGQQYSVEAQQNQIKDFARREKINISDWAIEDPISGTTKIENRPALYDALNILRRGDTFLALNVSRLARDEVVFYEIAGILARRGVKLRFADGTDASNPMNKMMMGILVMVASFERASISRRTKQGLKIARQNGKALGRPDRVRYGFYYESGLLKENEAEQQVLLEAYKLRGLGFSYRQIADHFTETGRYNRKGKPFAKQAIRQMFVQRSRDEEISV